MIDIKKLKHIHFTGIKGVGMTSLALCCDDLGIKITGSDVSEVFVTDEILKKREIPWRVGFSPKNLNPLPDLVITTGAHGGLTNPEVVFAKERGIPVMSHAEALANIADGKDTIAVCGVGGKTTTSSMLSVLLSSARRHPSFAIGVGNIYPIGTPGKFDKKGKEFVCEADEFVVSPGTDLRPRFMLLSPKIVVVTNIEHDHPDIYKNIDETKKTFIKFFEKIPKNGLLMACSDNKNVVEVLEKLKTPTATYGFSDKSDWQIKNFRIKDGKSCFSVNGVELVLNVPGRFNIQNVTAAFVVGKYLGLTDKEIQEGIRDFKGTRRRFERMGALNGAIIFDDYAHHPKEIEATLAAAREWFPKRRIIAVFQPHTYSRTKALFGDFARAFLEADVVGFMDIYASARETDTLGMNSSLLAKETAKHHKSSNYLGGHRETIKWLKKNVKRGDIVLTLGAGDIFKIYDGLF